MIETYVLIAAFAAFAVAFIGSGILQRTLRARAIMDQPNARSSHLAPTPRGGGIAVVAGLLAAGGAIAFRHADGGLVGVLALATVLAAVSWIDDLHTLSALPRLALHIVAVCLGLTALPDEGLVFQGLLPLWLDLTLSALAWIWFLNLFNFMDGIDGITGTETIAIGLGLALFAGGTGGAMGVVASGVMIGFLSWNKPPARLFLGDVGSVPLGFILGWLLLSLAASGQWAIALLLPLYYLADATITLIRRLIRGEKIWQAHRQHFYQQAVRVMEGEDEQSRARAHWKINGAIWLCNLMLLAAAWAVFSDPARTLVALVIGALAVAGLLWYFASRS